MRFNCVFLLVVIFPSIAISQDAMRMEVATQIQRMADCAEHNDVGCVRAGIQQLRSMGISSYERERIRPFEQWISAYEQVKASLDRAMSCANQNEFRCAREALNDARRKGLTGDTLSEATAYIDSKEKEHRSVAESNAWNQAWGLSLDCLERNDFACARQAISRFQGSSHPFVQNAYRRTLENIESRERSMQSGKVPGVSNSNSPSAPSSNNNRFSNRDCDCSVRTGSCAAKANVDGRDILFEVDTDQCALVVWYADEHPYTITLKTTKEWDRWEGIADDPQIRVDSCTICRTINQ